MNLNEWKKLYRSNQPAFYTMLWFTSAPVLSVFILIPYLQSHWQEFSQSVPVAAMVIVLSMAMSTGVLSSTLAAVLFGMLYGFTGIVSYTVAYAFAVYMNYEVVRFNGINQLGLHLSSRLPKVKEFNAQIAANEPKAIFLTRLLPTFPFAISTILLALQNVSMRSMLLYSVTGMLPRAMLAVWVGTEAGTVFSQGLDALNDDRLRISGLIFTVIAAALLYLTLKKKQ